MPKVFWEETRKITDIIANGESAPSDEHILNLQIRDWLVSKERHWQLEGEKYYKGLHDILRRQRTGIGEGGEVQEIKNLPNNLLIDNRYAMMVDQKVNYLLGMPFVVEGEGKKGKKANSEEEAGLEYSKVMAEFFDAKKRRAIHHLGVDCLNCGMAWLYLYHDEEGELAFRRFPAYEVLPIWRDDAHEELEYAIRLYGQHEYIGTVLQEVFYVEVYRQDGIHRYKYDNGYVVPDTEHPSYEAYITDTATGDTFNWERIPLIPFRYNMFEMSLLCRVKTLQDALNLALSDMSNSQEENAFNTLLILKNYDGQDLGEFRRNVNTHHAVKVRSTGDGADGDVTALDIGGDVEQFMKQIQELRDSLVANARGFDATDDRLSMDPNEMNIQSMYSEIDLDSKGMELEWQVSFQQLLWFVNQDLLNRGIGDFRNEKYKVIFNRDIMVNETQTIENVIKSMAVLSRETVVDQHPWVNNLPLELDRIEKQQQEELEMDYEREEALTEMSIQAKSKVESSNRTPTKQD